MGLPNVCVCECVLSLNRSKAQIICKSCVCTCVTVKSLLWFLKKKKKKVWPQNVFCFKRQNFVQFFHTSLMRGKADRTEIPTSQAPRTSSVHWSSIIAHLFYIFNHSATLSGPSRSPWASKLTNWLHTRRCPHSRCLLVIMAFSYNNLFPRVHDMESTNHCRLGMSEPSLACRLWSYCFSLCFHRAGTVTSQDEGSAVTLQQFTQSTVRQAAPARNNSCT